MDCDVINPLLIGKWQIIKSNGFISYKSDNQVVSNNFNPINGNFKNEIIEFKPDGSISGAIIGKTFFGEQDLIIIFKKFGTPVGSNTLNFYDFMEISNINSNSKFKTHYRLEGSNLIIEETKDDLLSNLEFYSEQFFGNYIVEYSLKTTYKKL